MSNLDTTHSRRLTLTDPYNFLGVLQKNGVNVATVNDILTAVPSQAGNAGKFLQTNGANTSWQIAAGAGTVSSVSVTTVNGVSATVTNPTTTPDLSFTLTNISPTSVNASSFITSGGLLTANAGQKTNRTATAINYTALATDFYIGVTNTAAPRTITLPAAATMANQVLVIKDESGGAGTGNITIDANGGETIDGALTFLLNVNYGSVNLMCDGSNWFTW